MNHGCECCHPCCRAVGDILQKSLHHHSSKQKIFINYCTALNIGLKKVKEKKCYNFLPFFILSYECKDKDHCDRFVCIRIINKYFQLSIYISFSYLVIGFL